MIRLALDYVKPGMVLARDIYGADGQVVLSAGVTLSDKYLGHLRRWDVTSVFVTAADLELPELEQVISEPLRAKTAEAVRAAFNAAGGTGAVCLSAECRQLVDAIIEQVLREKTVVLQLALLSRHQHDLFTHSVNVAVLSVLTAITLGLRDNKELFGITLGALVHDIGKVFIPRAILEKREPLNEEEAELVKAHASYGSEVLMKAAGYPPAVTQIAIQHHEHFDGAGYPRGLAGGDIALPARIVAVANAYENIVTGRDGHKGVDAHVAYEQILAGANRHFDPGVTKAFLARIAVYPVGTVVSLTTGVIGVVTKVTPLLPHRPQIKIFRDTAGKPVEKPYTIDLAERDHLTIFINRVLSDYEKAMVLIHGQPRAENR